MTKMAAMLIYGKNHKKSSTLEPVDRFQRNLVCNIGDWLIIVYINHNIRLTLTYSTARSIWVNRLFNEKKGNIEFSGSFVACHLKVGRYSQHVDVSIKGQSHFLTLAKGHLQIKCKT